MEQNSKRHVQSRTGRQTDRQSLNGDYWTDMFSKLDGGLLGVGTHNHHPPHGQQPSFTFMVAATITLSIIIVCSVFRIVRGVLSIIIMDTIGGSI